MMKNAAVLSKSWTISFAKPRTGESIAAEMDKLLQNLGGCLNYRGKIVGHLKAIAVAGDSCRQMSLTSLGRIGTQATGDWDEGKYANIALTVNIVIFGFSKAQLEEILRQSMADITLFAP